MNYSNTADWTDCTMSAILANNFIVLVNFNLLTVLFIKLHIWAIAVQFFINNRNTHFKQLSVETECISMLKEIYFLHGNNMATLKANEVRPRGLRKAHQ